ncbi:MAG: MurR/RpiR family transcriptional regulator [Chloroflexota bacterium]|nr:MurR/RpiR family transcriptional regulator [Chloroflexota bacterium]
MASIAPAITAHYGRLSAGQRRVMECLLSDSRFAAVVSAAELARLAGVSESTVTRAAQTLGFAGYPDLQARIRERFLNAMPERLGPGVAELGNSPEGAVKVMLEDAESIRTTAEDLEPHTLERVVEALTAARRIYVFGSRGSAGLAIILGIGLRMVCPETRLLATPYGDLADQLAQMTADDVLITISFRRVDRVSVAVTNHGCGIGATTIAITDHLSNPLARLASLCLIAHLGPLRLMPSYAAGASLVNAITTAVSIRNQAVAIPGLRATEQLLNAFETYAE